MASYSKWNPIPYTVHYFWPESYVPWSTVVHYIGNRVSFWTQTYYCLCYYRWHQSVSVWVLTGNALGLTFSSMWVSLSKASHWPQRQFNKMLLKWRGNNVDSTSVCPVAVMSQCSYMRLIRTQTWKGWIGYYLHLSYVEKVMWTCQGS